MSGVPEISSLKQTLAALRPFVRPRQPAARCEMCGDTLAHEHSHLIEPASRKILCCCDACSVLISGREASTYKRVPKTGRLLPDFNMTDAQWESFAIPINIAFFFNSSAAGKIIALYPSPAGPVESLLSLDAWTQIVQDNPVLGTMSPDVEALLVNRLGTQRGFQKPQYFLAPIDKCYELVGLIRSNWRGLSGGTEVWLEMTKFFDHLMEKCPPDRT